MLNAKKFLCLAFSLCLYWHTAWAQNSELRFVTWRAEVPKVWDEAVADFERQNPGIRLVREVGPQSSTQIHDLLTQKLKNRDPRLDVFFMDTIWPAEFASAGWGAPPGCFFSAAGGGKVLSAP